MKRGFILAIDQSTSATKALLFDTRGAVAGSAALEHRQYYPQPGWIEQDAEEIYANTLAAARGALVSAGARAEEVGAAALTNQRETVVVWNRSNGRPLHRAIIWQDRRGEALCRALNEAGHEAAVRSRTGLLIDPYFSASKIRWILDNAAGARTEAGALAFGTIDSWLLFRLTGGKLHATDFTNASRTMLFNLESLDWDDELLRLFGVPRSMAPEPLPSDARFGETDFGGLFPRPLPIAAMIGDSHGALFGQRCFEAGSAKATFGTGSSVMLNIGRSLPRPAARVVTSVGWGRGGTVDYVYEGNIHSTGDTVKWLVDGIGMLPDAASSEAIAREVSDTGGVYLVPAFSGLGAPYWDSRARGTIVGLTRGTTRAHLVRAALESIAYQIADLVDAMREESGVSLSALKVDGGATRNDFLMQLQADILGATVVRTGITDASALGAAYLAGLSTGVWSDLPALEALPSERTEFAPRMSAKMRESLVAGWREAVRRTLSST